jgi:hypothetical protein
MDQYPDWHCLTTSAVGKLQKDGCLSQAHIRHPDFRVVPTLQLVAPVRHTDVDLLTAQPPSLSFYRTTASDSSQQYRAFQPAGSRVFFRSVGTIREHSESSILSHLAGMRTKLISENEQNGERAERRTSRTLRLSS